MPSPPSPVDAFLQFDGGMKEVTVKPGEQQAHFTFTFTNVSSEPVTINTVGTSCGCTAAKLPPLPWTLAAGTNGEIGATMNLAGKVGTVTKTINVNTDKGLKVLVVQSVIPTPAVTAAPTETMGGMGNRADNQKVAAADRQAVLRGDCANCHVTPAKDKFGPELYAKACGICHEDEHRASMVPNLHALPHPTNADYWKNWITYGKPGSLMPAFAESEGGFLTEQQIASLVQYLTANIKYDPNAKPGTPAPHASSHANPQGTHAH